MNDANNNALKKRYQYVFNQLEYIRESHIPDVSLQEMGTVESVSAGIAIVSGLFGAGFEELLLFPNDIYGIAFNIDEHELSLIHI